MIELAQTRRVISDKAKNNIGTIYTYMYTFTYTYYKSLDSCCIIRFIVLIKIQSFSFANISL